MFEFSPTAFLLLPKHVDAVNAVIEHLLKESNVRNPGFALSQTLQCYCVVGNTICSKKEFKGVYITWTCFRDDMTFSIMACTFAM